MKRSLLWLLVISIILFIGNSSFAQTTGFEAHGLYAFEIEAKTDEFGKDDIADAVGLGASFIFSLYPNIWLDAGADWFKTRDKDLDNSDLTMTPLTASLRFGVDLEGVFLYAGGGIGYCINSIDLTADARSELEAEGIYELEIDDDLIYSALAGFEFKLNERLGVRAEFRYYWHKSEVKYENYLGHESRTDVRLDHAQGRAGLVVYF